MPICMSAPIRRDDSGARQGTFCRRGPAPNAGAPAGDASGGRLVSAARYLATVSVGTSTVSVFSFSWISVRISFW